MPPRKSGAKNTRKTSRKSPAAKTVAQKLPAQKSGQPSLPLAAWREKHLALPLTIREPLLLSLAASSKVRVDTAKSTSSPPNLLGLTFADEAVGITTKSAMATWKSNLSKLLPDFAVQIQDFPADPKIRIGDIAASLAALATSSAVSAPLAFAAGAIQEARKRIKNSYGSDFAAKASDAALRYLSQPRRESLSASGVPRLILEFSADLTQVDLPPDLSRRDRISLRREKFYRYMSPLRMLMEKVAGASSVEMCWLNQSVRISSGPKPVAEIAADSQLRIIDMPRRLRREVNVCSVTLGATAFRAVTGRLGNGIIVAVVDGEVDINHPALVGRVVLQKDYTGQGFGAPDLHGTAIAGIIASADATFTGIAPGAQIFNYKVFGEGEEISADDFDGATAVLQALSDGAHIANCSWGNGPATDGSSREAAACDNAWAEGMVMVKSAGNDGPAPSTMTTPADADGVIVVAATDRSGQAVGDYSSRGPSANGRHPHLSAPGGLSIDQIRSIVPGGGFGQVGRGTSFAAPMVSGIAALLLAGEPHLTPDQVRARLIARCRPFPDNDPNTHGAGFLDFSPAS